MRHTHLHKAEGLYIYVSRLIQPQRHEEHEVFTLVFLRELRFPSTALRTGFAVLCLFGKLDTEFMFAMGVPANQ